MYAHEYVLTQYIKVRSRACQIFQSAVTYTHIYTWNICVQFSFGKTVISLYSLIEDRLRNRETAAGKEETGRGRVIVKENDK